MYYHTTSAFERPTINPQPEVLPELENNSLRKWGILVLIAGGILAAGFLIYKATKNSWQIAKKNKSKKR